MVDIFLSTTPSCMYLKGEIEIGTGFLESAFPLLVLWLAVGWLKTTYHKNFPRDQLLCNKTYILCFEYLFCCIKAGLLENSYDK